MEVTMNDLLGYFIIGGIIIAALAILYLPVFFLLEEAGKCNPAVVLFVICCVWFYSVVRHHNFSMGRRSISTGATSLESDPFTLVK